MLDAENPAKPGMSEKIKGPAVGIADQHSPATGTAGPMSRKQGCQRTG